MHLRSRKNGSSTRDDKEHTGSNARRRSSSHFQHLFQRMITSATGRNRAPLRLPSQDKEENKQRRPELSLVSDGQRIQLPKMAQQKTGIDTTPLPEHASLDRLAKMSSEDTLRAQGQQTKASTTKKQDRHNHEPQLPFTASCDQLISFQLDHYNPKAREMLLTCTVCLDSLPLDNFPMVPITSVCLLEFHRATDKSFVCKSCINDSIDARLETSRPDDIRCPLCHQLMSHQEIKEWAEHETFEKYDRLFTLQALQQDGSFIRCWRPECEEGQFHDGDIEFPIAICQCGAMTCYRHSGLPWHEGLTCNEFEDPETAIRLLEELVNDLVLASRAVQTTLSKVQSQTTNEDTALQSKLDAARQLISERRAFLVSDSEQRTARAVAETTKPCPHCHAPVEKRGGCKHITCRCGYQFCYGCLTQWDLSHLATPCSDEHDHADVLRLRRPFVPPNPTPNPRPATQHARAFGAPRPLFIATGGAHNPRPIFGANPPINHNQRPHRIVNGRLNPSAPGATVQRPTIRPLLLSAGVQNREPHIFEDRFRLSDRPARTVATNAPVVNQQAAPTSVSSGSGTRGRLTEGQEQAILEAAQLLHNGATIQHDLGHQYRGLTSPPIRSGVGTAQIHPIRGTQLRNWARQFPQEGARMGPTLNEQIR